MGRIFGALEDVGRRGGEKDEVRIEEEEEEDEVEKGGGEVGGQAAMRRNTNAGEKPVLLVGCHAHLCRHRLPSLFSPPTLSPPPISLPPFSSPSPSSHLPPPLRTVQPPERHAMLPPTNTANDINLLETTVITATTKCTRHDTASHQTTHHTQINHDTQHHA